jgi:hypothetical protein
MFTDLVDSTKMTESHGDLTSRELIKRHDDIIKTIIHTHHGKLVKTMGDGTMSYFEEAQNAMSAAVAIQKKLQDVNKNKENNIPINVRIGLNYGEGIVEEKDIFGDVVNVAARFEALAQSGEIYLSESVFQALPDKGEFYTRIIKQATLKGKSEPVNVMKLFYKADEIEYDINHIESNPTSGGISVFGIFRVIIFFIIIASIIYALMWSVTFFEKTPEVEDVRSKKHTTQVIKDIKENPITKIRSKTNAKRTA